MEEGREKNVIREDFNIRIGEGELEEVGEMRRKSKDKIIGNNGKNMLDIMGEVGGYVMNGMTYGDKEGEFTYVEARGSSVIDYVIVNKNGKEIVKEFKVEEKVDSDHMPLIVKLKEKEGNEEDEEAEEERRIRDTG